MEKPNSYSFIVNSIKHIRTAGTVFPSSAALTGKMIAGINFSRAKCFVEFGGGNGCITRKLLRNMRPDAKLICFEINPQFTQMLQRINDDRLHVVNDSASNLEIYLHALGFDKADYIVSGLPLAILDKHLTAAILANTKKLLQPQGTFIQFQYSLQSHNILKRRFSKVSVNFTPFNLPPAFIYHCSI